jgi:hypothetical protein
MRLIIQENRTLHWWVGWDIHNEDGKNMYMVVMKVIKN